MRAGLGLIVMSGWTRVPSSRARTAAYAWIAVKREFRPHATAQGPTTWALTAKHVSSYLTQPPICETRQHLFILTC